ncbi:hypothetical protein [Thermococcus sp. LS2]|uniref:hypothetical protein n=1 Tax=Thermococcus sp. LS2 TaxID=1638260 RepID=UPI00143944E2|nr:hypothetical protein [Thermococcus sp. LS2]NJE11875.1 hypothetical protein [Thermococcus sp. LS2]
MGRKNDPIKRRLEILKFFIEYPKKISDFHKRFRSELDVQLLEEMLNNELLATDYPLIVGTGRTSRDELKNPSIDYEIRITEKGLNFYYQDSINKKALRYSKIAVGISLGSLLIQILIQVLPKLLH